MAGPESSGDDKDNTVAKTAGFVVISGIAMSILKAALTPFTHPKPQSQTLSESTRPIRVPDKKPEVVSCISETVAKPDGVTKAPELSRKTVEIVKGDTLWGLSRKYGVTIDEIKKANGLSNDKIYAGKKLIIP